MKTMTELSHSFLKPVLHRQAVCIDATLGRGRDAQFFLEQGVRQVVAYEIQPEPFEEVRTRIRDPRFLPKLRSHDCMEEDLAPLAGAVDAVIFNFGYDPAQPQGIQSDPQTSCHAVLQALRLLRLRGRMALVFYAHPQGVLEREMIMHHLEDMDGLQILSIRHPFKRSAPELLCIEKIKQGAHHG